MRAMSGVTDQPRDDAMLDNLDDLDDLREQARSGELVRAVLVQPASSLYAGQSCRRRPKRAKQVREREGRAGGTRVARRHHVSDSRMRSAGEREAARAQEAAGR